MGASVAVLRTQHDPAVSAAPSRIVLPISATSGKWREDRALDGCAYCLLCLPQHCIGKYAYYVRGNARAWYVYAVLDLHAYMFVYDIAHLCSK